MKVFHLKKNFDRRFRQGHPWVFSNELLESPKTIENGEIVELRDPSGKFLCRGWGSSTSLIAIRELTRNENELQLTGTSQDGEKLTQFFLMKLQEAFQVRESLGRVKNSFRWIFGEVDGLPGLVIDAYLESESLEWVIVFQAHSAGADKSIPFIKAAILKFFKAIAEKKTNPFWLKQNFKLVIRNDVAVRKLEGLEVEDSYYFGTVADGVNEAVNRSDPDQAVREYSRLVSLPGNVKMQVDFLKGQKTGFFLDQTQHILALRENLKHKIIALNGESSVIQLKVLDLCCYVGHWSTQLVKECENIQKQLGCKVNLEINLVDISEFALQQAEENIKRNTLLNVKIIKHRLDVIHDLNASQEIPHYSYDIVIADPPALIKNKKSIPQGQHAYLQLYTQAILRAKKSAFFVASSCSSHLVLHDFLAVLAKAVQRHSKDKPRSIAWFYQGGVTADHPGKVEFSEGSYLKTWMGLLR